jgi:uncharacterized RDD family membrane protein YckC
MTNTNERNIFPAPASFGRRFLASVVDTFILIIPGFMLNSALPYFGGLLIWFFYAPIFECSELRATIGKHAMGIQVTDTKGQRLTFPSALMRNVIKLISSTLCFVGHLFALFTERAQAVHDMVADSVVVYGRIERPFWNAWVDSFKSIFGSLPSVPHTSGSGPRIEELERLQALREKGALTEEEFQRAKNNLL